MSRGKLLRAIHSRFEAEEAEWLSALLCFAFVPVADDRMMEGVVYEKKGYI